MQLEIKDIHKSFGSKEVLKGIELSLGHGVYGLLGPNGAGKTTLIRIIAGIMDASRGKIMLDHKDKDNVSTHYANYIGYLPQEVDFYSDFTAREYLNYIAVLKGLSESETKKKVEDLARQVNLSENLEQRCITFSGGMKRRLGIAQALLNDPEILILDEPTAGLDPFERIKFRNIISALAKDRTVLLSTHIVSDVDCIAKEIIMIKDGVVGKRGTRDSLIGAIQNCVWNVQLRLDQLMDFQKTHIISNIMTEDETVMLRVIENQQPIKEAYNVEPNLEDVYLYEFTYQGGIAE